jgi:hypothetical protein
MAEAPVMGKATALAREQAQEPVPAILTMVTARTTRIPR